MQSVGNLFQAAFDSFDDCAFPELKPFRQQMLEVIDPGQIVQANDIEVDPISAFKVGRGKQMAHQRIAIDPVVAKFEYKTGRIRLIALVPEINNHRQALRSHLCRNLFHDLRSRHLVRQGRNHD